MTDNASEIESLLVGSLTRHKQGVLRQGGAYVIMREPRIRIEDTTTIAPNVDVRGKQGSSARNTCRALRDLFPQAPLDTPCLFLSSPLVLKLRVLRSYIWITLAQRIVDVHKKSIACALEREL